MSLFSTYDCLESVGFCTVDVILKHCKICCSMRTENETESVRKVKSVKGICIVVWVATKSPEVARLYQFEYVTHELYHHFSWTCQQGSRTLVTPAI